MFTLFVGPDRKGYFHHVIYLFIDTTLVKCEKLSKFLMQLCLILELPDKIDW